MLVPARISSRVVSYIDHLSAVFSAPGRSPYRNPLAEPDERIYALPFERHVIYFLQTEAVVIVIRVLSQHQDAGRHLHWR
ncbi:type II toxin-antitoxin system RelE/ParE family toxin [Salmonella enterica subsp. enterica serovar Agona]|nr:type II toxin-antitoxin system RelE/ParE family toxin [Salmonella enterica subsp. enterica serovar Agona]ECM4294506.1 type II toxin-antitoxin system RelE/ParE family toxin [Salmonella enterica subsp. enterica serovar Montevideo]EED3651551.1 type II toxin-antitoxin system RelE/ParE family toxin [Salmonella enterica subsp. enterica serovar Agona]